MSQLFQLFIYLTACSVGCSGDIASKNPPYGYDFARPTWIQTLPEELHEISGLVHLDTTLYACIQDELGVLYLYDIDERKIQHSYTFYLNGDYEGITKVDSSLYVLRSDGVILQISNYKNDQTSVKLFETGIPASNNEGLCYDPKNNRLMIAAKGKIDRTPENKNKRFIYGFDLIQKSTMREPIYILDMQKVQNLAKEKNIKMQPRVKKDGRVTEAKIRLKASALAIHPISQQLFLLSAVDHLMIILDPEGNAVDILQLSPELFNKAEGISFLPNGDMLISNEGQDKKPTLLLFEYHAP